MARRGQDGMRDTARSVEALLSDQVRFAPDTGHIQLFDQRMLLVQGVSLGELRRELVVRLGVERAKEMITRLGYQHGLENFRRVHDLVGNDPDRLVAMGIRLTELEGFVRVEPIEKFSVDVERGTFAADCVWNASWEAEAHLHHLGISGTPACWMMTGFASGYSTALLGRPVVWREVECQAMGHARCRAMGKPLDEWENAGELGSFLQIESFVDLPQSRPPIAPLTKRNASSTAKGKTPFEELVGASAAFNAVVHLIQRVAPSNATVLLLGESGVGKERFFKALHSISRRATEPCVSVNCAAIPAELVEAELFGVERGAFTGATESRPGRFERANGGTLFLDEIGSLPMPAQGKLLRILQEGEVERVGDTCVRPVDVRIVAAANHDLRQEIEQGRFRADLFYRLNVFPIEIPPLRQRRDDILLMFNVFVERYARRDGKEVGGVTRRALDAMWNYDWPGNVRELENLVERAVILTEPGEPIDIHHLFTGGEKLGGKSLAISPVGRLSITETGRDDNQDPVNALIDKVLDEACSLDGIESRVIQRALDRSNGNVSAAARLLNMGRGQLQYRLSKSVPEQDETF